MADELIKLEPVLIHILNKKQQVLENGKQVILKKNKSKIRFFYKKPL